jgi:hypothetical protein
MTAYAGVDVPAEPMPNAIATNAQLAKSLEWGSLKATDRETGIAAAGAECARVFRRTNASSNLSIIVSFRPRPDDRRALSL